MDELKEKRQVGNLFHQRIINYPEKLSNPKRLEAHKARTEIDLQAGLQ